MPTNNNSSSVQVSGATHAAPLESHTDFISILIDRMSPTTSKYVPEELRNQYKDSVDRFLKAGENHFVGQLKKEHPHSEWTPVTYDGRTVPQYCFLLILLLIPLTVLFLSEIRLTGISMNLRRLIEDFSSDKLWILFIPGLIWLIVSGKINNSTDASGHGILMYITYVVMALLTIIRFAPFGLRMIWIPLFAIINGIILIKDRKEQYKSLRATFQKEEDIRKEAKAAEEEYERSLAQLDESARNIDAIYQQMVDRLNQIYNTDYELPPCMPWWRDMKSVAEPWQRIIPGTFMGVADKKPRVNGYQFRDYTNPLSEYDITTTYVEDFETDWILITYDSAVNIIKKGSFKPIFGVSYPLEALNRPRFLFMLRTATWTTVVERETQSVTSSLETKPNELDQKLYKLHNLVSDLNNYGTTVEALQNSPDPGVAQRAEWIQEARDKELSNMSFTTVETSAVVNTSSSSSKGKMYGGILVMDLQDKRPVEAFYPGACPIENAQFFYEYLNDSAMDHAGYYNLPCDPGSTKYVAKTAFLTWDEYKNEYRHSVLKVDLPYLWE